VKSLGLKRNRRLDFLAAFLICYVLGFYYVCVATNTGVPLLWFLFCLCPAMLVYAVASWLS